MHLSVVFYIELKKKRNKYLFLNKNKAKAVDREQSFYKTGHNNYFGIVQNKHALMSLIIYIQ